MFYVLFQCVPVLFISSITKLSALCSQYSWMCWVVSMCFRPCAFAEPHIFIVAQVRDLPVQVVGVLEGLVPVIILSVMLMFLPPLLACLSRCEVSLTYVSQLFPCPLCLHYFLVVILVIRAETLILASIWVYFLRNRRNYWLLCRLLFKTLIAQAFLKSISTSNWSTIFCFLRSQVNFILRIFVHELHP